MNKNGKTKGRQSEDRRRCLPYFFWLLTVFFLILYYGEPVRGAEPVKVEFFYENVCASCEGDADFYEIYNGCISKEEKDALDVEIATYNLFLKSCEPYYESAAERLGIPDDVTLPVLVIGDRWMSGYGQIEEELHEVLLAQSPGGAKADETGHDRKAPEQGQGAEDGGITQMGPSEQSLSVASLAKEIRKTKESVLILFTTNSCKDCEQVKDWMGSDGTFLDTEILEYNIIEDNCLEFLQDMFREYGVDETDQHVPALFFGDQSITGASSITSLDAEQLLKDGGNGLLADKLEASEKAFSEKDQGNRENGDRMNLFTLAGAGLLAGFNPCSISMLLMLLSFVIGEKSSVWKNGLLYLLGKYAAYFTMGLIIFVTASQIDSGLLEKMGRGINGILVLLFTAAGILYLADAVRIFRQDYGGIRTQLPVGMRRFNHRLIRRVSGYSGLLQPMTIIGLGIAISLGEFFCTGQIYMAAITYMLKDQVTAVWLPFLVYVTAMSLPAFFMIVVIQKTRNTERVSEFMLRHLGTIKLFNAALFFGFVVYFLFF